MAETPAYKAPPLVASEEPWPTSVAAGSWLLLETPAVLYIMALLVLEATLSLARICWSSFEKLSPLLAEAGNLIPEGLLPRIFWAVSNF